MGSFKKFHNLISVQVFIYQAPHDHKAIFCSDIAESSQRKALCMQPGQNAGIQTPPHPSQREQLNQQKKTKQSSSQTALTPQYQEDRADSKVYFPPSLITLSCRHKDKVVSQRYSRAFKLVANF